MPVNDAMVPQFSLRDIARVLFKRKAELFVLYFTMVAVSVLFCFFWPPTYEAAVRILVKHDREPAVVSLEQGSIRTVSRQTVTESDLNTEMEMVQSSAVLEETARALEIDKLPEHWAIRLLNVPINAFNNTYNWYHNKQNPDAFAKAVKRLRQRVSVTPKKRSAIIEVRLRWGDPAFASKILDRLSQAYIAEHLSLISNPGTRDFFAQQAEAKKRELDDIERRIEAIRPGATVELVRIQQELYAKHAIEIESQWRNARAREGEAISGTGAYRDIVNNTPDRIITDSRPVFSDQALGAMKSRVLELQLQRAQLLQKYRPENPLIIQVENALHQAEEMLQREVANPVSQQTTSNNPVQQRAQENLAVEEAELSKLKALQDGSLKEFGEVSGELGNLNRQALAIERLDRQRRTTEAAYTEYLKRAEDARAADELNQLRMVNVTLIEPVRAGDRPVRPDAKLILELTAGLGLLLSIGFVFLLELLDHRIKSERDVELVVGAPVLATFDAIEAT